MARSCSHRCGGKSICISYFECMFVATYIQDLMSTCHIDICDLSGSTIFFHIITQTALFSKTKVMNIKCVYWFCLQLFSEKVLVAFAKLRKVIIRRFIIFISSILKFSLIKNTDFLKHEWQNKHTSKTQANHKENMRLELTVSVHSAYCKCTILSPY